jgi:hypothetical protein
MIFSSIFVSTHLAGLIDTFPNISGGTCHCADPVATHGTPQSTRVNLYKILCVEDDTVKATDSPEVRHKKRSGDRPVR